jgi:hypothetical protein
MGRPYVDPRDGAQQGGSSQASAPWAERCSNALQFLDGKSREGKEDLSQPFDGHHDAIVYLAGYLYKALKVAREEP